MIILKKIVIFLVIIISLTMFSCKSKIINNYQEDKPPVINVTINGEKIPVVCALNEWDNVKYDREDTFITFVAENKKQFYVKSGAKINFLFENKKTPDKYKLLDFVLNENGSVKHTEKETVEVPILFKNGSGEFVLQ